MPLFSRTAISMGRRSVMGEFLSGINSLPAHQSLNPSLKPEVEPQDQGRKNVPRILRARSQENTAERRAEITNWLVPNANQTAPDEHYPMMAAGVKSVLKDVQIS